MSSNDDTTPPSLASEDTTKKSSLLQIQAEQQKQQQHHHQQQQSRRGGGGGGGSGYRKSRSLNYDDMPTELGVICSLKESFGFIHCADRPEELFFHFSEVVRCHTDDLRVDDEISFRVGPASTRGGNNNNQSDTQQQKLAAYQIQLLPRGEKIEWEIEEGEPGARVLGIVERPARSDNRGGNYNNNNSNNNNNQGSIRLLSTEEEEQYKQMKHQQLSPEEQFKATGKTIRYLANEFPDSSGGDNNNRGGIFKGGNNQQQLRRGDVIECSLVTDRRTKQTFAKSIKLIQSQQQRNRMGREQKLLQSATREEGIVTCLKHDYGFIKSNKRKEDVYFHYSNLILPDDDGDFVLKEGQELKFLVVTEDQSPSNNSQQQHKSSVKCSARQLECLPKGSVIFHKVIAKGITGVVTMSPRPPSNYIPPSTGNDGKPPQPSAPVGNDERYGTVRLDQPLYVTFEDESSDDNAKEECIRNVMFHFDDSPGGVFCYQNRTGNVVGMWVQENDRLLFDVVQDISDGSYRIAPTAASVLSPLIAPPTTRVSISSTADGSSDENKKDENAAVRLVDISLVGRAEGVVHTIKDGYGFIHLADRPVDVHFKFYDMLPDEVQNDLRKKIIFQDNLDGSKTPQQKRGSTSMKPCQLEVGASVQFDISVHGTVSTGPRNKHHRGGHHKGGHHSERENLKAQRVLLLPPSHSVVMEKVLATDAKAIVKSQDTKQLYAGYIDILPPPTEDSTTNGTDSEEQQQSEQSPPLPPVLLETMSIEERHPLVAQMIDSFLEESSSTDPGSRKSLVFRDILSMKDDEVILDMVNAKGHGILSCTHIPVAGLTSHPGRLCIRRIDGETKEGDDADTTKKSTKNKHKHKNNHNNKGLRFDKSSLIEELKGDIPPGIGDIVQCDVVQVRRTGKVSVQNMKMIERIEREVIPAPADADTTTGGGAMMNGSDDGLSHGVGLVKEVVQNRNFGFISVLDENATKRELLFFHLTDHNKHNNRKFRKGDEVKFDIGTEGKNGKRVAFNVQVVPKGTIPSKASKNACRGFILMDPSHTTLSDTPVRGKLHSSASGSSDKSGGGGRWRDNTPTNHTASPKEIVEEGCILLLEDKTGMFTKKRNQKGNRGRSASLSDDELEPDHHSEEENHEETAAISLLTHLPYKNGAIAIHGSGASSCMDGSSNPRRGDLVSFVKGKSGKGVRDIRVVTRQNATLIRGRLENIVRGDSNNKDNNNNNNNKGTAKFIATATDETKEEKEYIVPLEEVVSCDITILKEKQAVEGVLYQGKIYGICRTMDLYLESKLGASHKERPKLNLSVKKDRGGTIIAQSMMAKGPDGSNGFASGWTKRKSVYAA